MGNWIEIPIPDPKSPKDLVIGSRVQLGLRQDWTLLEFKRDPLFPNEGIMLVVRPHRVHPFVTEIYSFRSEDGELICWGGHYHETLAEAIEDFNDRTSGW